MEKDNIDRNFVRIIVIFAIIIFTISSGILWIGWKQGTRYERLYTEGKIARATIVKKEERPAIRSGPNYVLIYEFKIIGGTCFSDQWFVPGNVWRERHVGQEFDIQYLPDDPSIHVPFLVNKEQVSQPLQSALKYVLALVSLGLGLPIAAHRLVIRRRMK